MNTPQEDQELAKLRTQIERVSGPLAGLRCELATWLEGEGKDAPPEAREAFESALGQIDDLAADMLQSELEMQDGSWRETLRRWRREGYPFGERPPLDGGSG